MNDLERLAGSLGVSDRTLRRAAAEGLIRVSRTGPRRTHVTVGESAYLSRAWPGLSSLRAALRTEPNVRLAVLFGSFARGDDRLDSDIDMMVDLAGGDRGRRDELQERLAVRLDRDVQLLSLADARREPSLLADIVRDGRVLVDRDHRWRSIAHGRRVLQRRADADLDARAARAIARVAAMES